MRNLYRHLFLSGVYLFLGLLSVDAHAGSLQGLVKGPDSAGKYNALVRFDGAARYSATTDDKGKFTIRNFTAGDYTITVQQEGHRQKFVRTIKIPLGSPLHLEVPW